MDASAIPAAPWQSTLPTFEEALRRRGLPPLHRAGVTTLQVNGGKLCNQACHHCHVEASPKRTEIMTPKTADRVVTLLEPSPSIETFDLTGGAPELKLSFRYIELPRQPHIAAA